MTVGTPPGGGNRAVNPAMGRAIGVTYTIRDGSGKTLESHIAVPLLIDADHVEQYQAIVKDIAKRVRELQ